YAEADIRLTLETALGRGSLVDSGKACNLLICCAFLSHSGLILLGRFWDADTKIGTVLRHTSALTTNDSVCVNTCYFLCVCLNISRGAIVAYASFCLLSREAQVRVPHAPPEKSAAHLV